MPNWCHNTLEVRGEKAELEAFVERARPTDARLRKHYEEARTSKWIPKEERPTSFEEYASKARATQPLSFESHAPILDQANWYEWSIANWGTKWDASFSGPFIAMMAPDASVDDSVAAKGMVGSPEAGMVVYKFDTAWSPPIGWLEKTSEIEKELEFLLRFGEPGSDAAGEIKLVNGVVIESRDLEIKDVLAPEEMWF